MRIAAGDRPLRGDQGLGQHLPAEHPPPAVVGRKTDEAVLSGRREIEQGDEIDRGHKGRNPEFGRRW